MSMAGPDRIVERAGETITLERVIDYEIDANGQVQNVETELETVNAIVSQPSEEDEQRVEGRLSTGSLKLTLPSDVDVAGDRDAERDRIYRPSVSGWEEGGWGESGWGGVPSTARRYRVVEARNDRNPLTGTSKLTVIVDEDGGRVPHPTPTSSPEEDDESEDPEPSGWGESGWGEGTWGGSVEN